MLYFIDSKDGSLQATQNCGDIKPFFTVMSTAEFHECKEQLPYYKELLHCLGSIRYCKAEVFKNCIIGTLRLPQKSEQRSPQLSFGFYLTGQSLLFVEDVGDLKSWVDKRIDMLQELNSPAQLLLQFMEQMIEDDVLYLSHIESETEKINRHSPYLSITLHKCYPYYLFGISTFPNSAYHSIALRKFSITIV